MGLMDELKAEGSRPRVICKAQITLDLLPADEAADLRAAFADPLITAAAIERVLSRKGHKLPQATISRHRRKECTCE